MKKISILLVIMLVLSTLTLHAQAPAATSAEGSEISYGIVGLTYNLGYFFKTRSAMDNMGIVGKIPLSERIGIEIGLANLDVPVKEYNIPGLTNPTNIIGVGGVENFTEIKMNILYYMPFLSTFQAKMGLSYVKWNNGFIVVDPSVQNCGYLVNFCKWCRKSTFLFNIGANLDVPIVQQFYGMTSLALKMFLDDGEMFIAFNMGLGYKF